MTAIEIVAIAIPPILASMFAGYQLASMVQEIRSYRRRRREAKQRAWMQRFDAAIRASRYAR